MKELDIMTTTVLMGRGQSRLLNLRFVLAFDALTCLAMGALLVGAAAPLAAQLGLPEALLFRAGVLLFPCAALMGLAAGARSPSRGLTLLVILGNAAWVVASIAVLMLIEASALGVAVVLAQAAVVAALLVLERRGMSASA
jgi:hypothetical protein